MSATAPRPLVLIVSGPPCTGKTSLARRLAASFTLPLMTKDTIFVPIQVNCIADPEVLLARFHKRARSGERHRGHQDHLPPSPLDLPIPGRLDPLDIGGHVIELDMTDFAQLNHDQLCVRIRQLWSDDGQS